LLNGKLPLQRPVRDFRRGKRFPVNLCVNPDCEKTFFIFLWVTTWTWLLLEVLLQFSMQHDSIPN
jgi:hypothetical protein